MRRSSDKGRGKPAALVLFPTARKLRPWTDFVAALTLAAIAIPEQLATAQLAGLPAGQGIVVFVAAALVMVIVSRSRSLSVGADSTIAPVLIAAGAGSSLPGSMALLAGMVGVILLIVALLRLEGLARLLSMPVATGMMAGIALHILVGRIPVALGLDPQGIGVIDVLYYVWAELPAAHAAPLALTVLVTGICKVGRVLDRRLPAPLIAIGIAAGITGLIDPNAVLLQRSGDTSVSLGLALPTFEPEVLLAQLPTALTVAFLCLFQTTVVLRDGDEDTSALRRNAFTAVGLSNLASAAIGGFAVNSSPPRTQLVRDAGASGQLVALGAAIVGLFVLTYGSGLLRFLPSAALAGILVFIALQIFPWLQFKRLIRHSRAEAGIAIATMAFVTLLPLHYGAPLAILLSLFYATLPLFASQVVELSQIPGTTVWWHRPNIATCSSPGDALVLGLTSPVNFANAEGIVAEIQNRVEQRSPTPRVLILEGAGMLSVDMTGADCLAALTQRLQELGIRVGFARVESDRAREQLKRSGLLDVLGRDNIFNSVEHALRSLS